MRRVLIVLTVAALVAAMMVSAGPAQAQANERNLESGINAFQVGDTLIASGDDDFDLGDSNFGFGDGFGFDGVDGLAFAFDGGDDEHFGDGTINDEAFLFCVTTCDFDEFGPGDVDTNIG